jgi:GNAT superfamily N-acetyltransferase
MKNANDYDVVAGVPDADTYLRLRKAGGLSAFSEQAAKKGLGGSFLGVIATFNNEPIGMGRVIGDGGCFFQIVDIVVEPDHQGRGLGKRIMEALMEQLRRAAPASAYVSLIADVPADKLYQQFGFRETAPRSIGMSLFLR